MTQCGRIQAGYDSRRLETWHGTEEHRDGVTGEGEWDARHEELVRP